MAGAGPVVQGGSAHLGADPRRRAAPRGCGVLVPRLPQARARPGWRRSRHPALRPASVTVPAPWAGTPWASALGDRVDELSPALAAYFGGSPEGSNGIGEGVFTTVGTPRRWLWPLLALLGRWNIVWPVWEREVPFSIVNVPTPHGLIGVRRLRFSSGDRTMTDRILWTPHGLRQRLGAGERVVAELFVEPEDG